MGAAELIAELAFVCVPEHDEVGAVAGFEHAHIRISEKIGCVGRACGNRFGGGDAEVPHGKSDGHGHRQAWG